MPFSMVTKLKFLSFSQLTKMFKLFSYKSEMNDVPVQTVAGSTLPLVQLPRDEEAFDYNPFENRKVAHPTT